MKLTSGTITFGILALLRCQGSLPVVHSFASPRRSPPPSSSSSSTPITFVPPIAGQSLAHNLHELVLGVLINSDGQRVLSKKSETLGSRRSSRSAAAQSKAASTSRVVSKVERFDRIPTWPAKNGLRFAAISRINPDLAADLEHRLGGADCPNLWLPYARQTSPFLMMCHHNHSFDLKDPMRLLEKNVVPEGFPAHAHRGMTTVTICLRGGMVHRDSLGNKELFGADDPASSSSGARPYGGKHMQWLTFGRGIVHELMWDNEPRREGQRGRRGTNGSVIHQEIYQIWIDLPQSMRYTDPRVKHLGGHEGDTPVVNDANNKIRTTIIAGEYNGVRAAVDTISDLAIFRVEIDGPHRRWTHRAPSLHSSMIIYVRTGSLTIGDTRIPAHCTAYLSPDGDTIDVRSEDKGVDFLFLAGKPLDQNVVARGSMVAESREELQRAFHDYEGGEMGMPWNEGCSDEEWRRHLMKTTRDKRKRGR